MRVDTLSPVNRFVELEGAVNFRDIGGYLADGTRRVSRGLVYRADGLSRLTTGDIEKLRALGIKTVIDLRSTDEWEGGHFPTDKLSVAIHHLPFIKKLDHPEDFDIKPGLLASQYVEIIDDSGSQIVAVLELLAEDRALPAVIHCTAGKDRTGVMIALLLSLLFIQPATVISDYALSKGAMVDLRKKLIERYPQGKEIIEKVNEVFSAEPENMESLLSYVDETFGSPFQYILKMGIDEKVIKTLRTALLEKESD